MKSYNKIDLDETPIVVLGCGHFFTAETLDGHMGMGHVYMTDGYGEFTGLKDVSAMLAQSIPRCPDCQCPVRQYVTQRYNRVINRAVIDEISIRFLVDGQNQLQALGQQTNELERNLETTREDILYAIRQGTGRMVVDLTTAKFEHINKELQRRYEKNRVLQKAIQYFCTKVADSQQPTQKLHNATVNSARRRSFTGLMTDLMVVDSVPALVTTVPCNRQIILGGRLTQIRADCILIADMLILVHDANTRDSSKSVKIPGGNPNKVAKLFFQTCKTLIDDCNVENLPKLSVEATLYYARLVRPYESHCRSINSDIDKASEHMKIAKALLEKAKEMCAQPFAKADKLFKAVEESIKLLGKEWYEKVTAEELATIKAAMVSGKNGIATHSGHWYNCANGHPVSERRLKLPPINIISN
jgi:hypothetical protein